MPDRNDNSDTRNIRRGENGLSTGSIAHAAGILTCIGNDIHALTDIARQCRLGKSTVHRGLKLLEQSRLVVQDAINRRYYLGPLVMQLASNPITTHEYLIMYANEEMKRLSRLSEETVALDILVGVRQFVLYEIPSQHDLRVMHGSGIAVPFQAGASVKALFSLLSDKQLKTAMDSLDITRTTERTVTDKGLLTAQIKEIRRQGYAVSCGERFVGGMCVSVPIKSYNLPVALSVVGPESRLRLKEKEVIAELKASSARISEDVKRLFVQQKD